MINKKLLKYLKKNKLTHQAFGNMLNPKVTGIAVSHWVNGRNTPTLARIKQIEKLTKGEVDIKAFLRGL